MRSRVMVGCLIAGLVVSYLILVAVVGPSPIQFRGDKVRPASTSTTRR